MPDESEQKSWWRRTFNRPWLLLALLVGTFLALRGAWVGMEGLTGKIQLDQRDWKNVIMFLVIGTAYLFTTLKRMRQAKPKGPAE